MRCEARTLDDIRALGGNDAADERCFAAMARVSEMNLALYRTFAQPAVRAFFNSSTAEWMRQSHPLRLQYELFSKSNPLMASVAAMADQVRKSRKPATADNPFIAMQENASHQIVAALDAWRDANEAIAERVFMTVYGSSTLQAAVGIDPAATQPQRKARRSLLHLELMENRIGELKSRVAAGGVREALIRGLLFAGMGRAAVDERGFEAVRRIRQTYSDVPLSEFKATVREQFYILLIDTEGALAAIPSMLPEDPDIRQKAFDLINQVLSARGEFSAEDRARLHRVAGIFGAQENLNVEKNAAIPLTDRSQLQAKAS